MLAIIKSILKILVLFSLFFAAFIGGTLWFFSNPDCYYDEIYAKERAISFLNRYELDSENLSLLKFDSETCKADFNYSINGRDYSIYVINDFVKGAKVVGDLGAIADNAT